MSSNLRQLRDPEASAFEGRTLPRAHAELVDQGVRFDVVTILSRRRLLGLTGLGAGAAALAACAPTSAGTANAPTPAASGLPGGEIPDETAGPFPGDGSNGPDALAMSGIVRKDIRTNIGQTIPVDGVQLDFTLRLTDMSQGDAPLTGAAVYAWHCDSQGRYSMYSAGVEQDTFLRGLQVADDNGQVTFTSVVPGCYDGRWPHIHFEVYPDLDSISAATNAISTSQLAVPANLLPGVYEQPGYEGSASNLSRLSLTTDNVFGDDGGALQVATTTGDVSTGYIFTLGVRIDPRTAPPLTSPGGPGGLGGPRGPEAA